MQRAYRLVCQLGTFDETISQSWLLKALGDRSFTDAARILNALSDDIVLEKDEDASPGANTFIGPRHRLIAEEVLNVAVPEPHHRVLDILRLIGSANLASELEGMLVARLLRHKGPLLSWLRSSFPDYTEHDIRTRDFFLAAIQNGPLHPSVEITLRQHYALCLRRHNHLDDALEEVRAAERLDAENPATLHIMGLIHEKRALQAWGQLMEAADVEEGTVRRARGHEADALEFFRRVRERQPDEEYGYESEARYFHKKFRKLAADGSAAERTDVRALRDSARSELLASFGLLRTAEARISDENIAEIPTTKANVLAALGDHRQALRGLEEELGQVSDPIRRNRLLRAAAALAAESHHWTGCVGFARQAIAAGEHDAGIYLLLDSALSQLTKSVAERISAFRESAETWNSMNVPTLVRWAELLWYFGNHEAAARALARADGASRGGHSIFSRERARAIIREGGPYSSRPMRFQGTVLRLSRPNEGIATLDGLERGVWFRLPRTSSEPPKIGDAISYELAIRIRGLAAWNVRLEISE